MAKAYKNLAEQLEYEHIQELKKDHEGAYSVELDKTGICYIRILNRGEQMFYQDNDRAFICEISVLYDVVLLKSIKKRPQVTSLRSTRSLFSEIKQT